MSPMRRTVILLHVTGLITGIRFTLDQIETMIKQCEDATREPGNMAKPCDFEPVRVARSILLKAIEPVNRCEIMSDDELQQFHDNVKRAADEAEKMLLDQHEIVLWEISYHNDGTEN